jgi:TetR/AcrR family transcriptional regulator, transcriptional repressor for nem operon
MRALRKGEETRERLLAATEQAVLEKGFVATSIDELIAQVGITKSGFFYHFRDKNELALAMLERYLAEDQAQFDAIFRRAAEFSSDPLQRFLIGMKFIAEMMDDRAANQLGCVAASLAYQEKQIDRLMAQRMREAAMEWRRQFRVMLDEIAAAFPPNDPIDLDIVADMCTSAMQGGFILRKMLKDPGVMGQQVMALRSYVKLLFQPVGL